MSETIRWAILRLMSGDLGDDREIVDAELDLDDFQLMVQPCPGHPEYQQIVINLSGNDWNKIKDLPIIKERSK